MLLAVAQHRRPSHACRQQGVGGCRAELVHMCGWLWVLGTYPAIRGTTFGSIQLAVLVSTRRTTFWLSVHVRRLHIHERCGGRHAEAPPCGCPPSVGDTTAASETKRTAALFAIASKT